MVACGRGLSQSNHNGIMLKRSGTVRASVVIRVILLVFVDNFGTTDIYEIHCWISFKFIK